MTGEAEIYRALQIIDRADGPVTIEYLSRRMGIPDYQAYEILAILAERGFVKRRLVTEWSKSMSPKFEISVEGRLKINSISEKFTEVLSEFL